MSREEALPRLGAGAPPRRRLLARGRSLTPVVLFWTSTLAVNASTVAVVAFLSHHQVSGGLPEASAVLALSLVIAVAPGALQLRAAADVAEAQPTPRPPWRLFGPLSVGLLLLAPLVAWAVSIPVIAAVLVALQLPPAVALSVCRGELIGSRRFGAAGLNLSVDAIVRLVAGVGLGLLWGATGIAAALALATLVALVVVWHRHELGAPALGGAVVVSGVALASVACWRTSTCCSRRACWVRAAPTISMSPPFPPRASSWRCSRPAGWPCPVRGREPAPSERHWARSPPPCCWVPRAR